MQRITSIAAARRELGGLAARTSQVACPWIIRSYSHQPAVCRQQQWACVQHMSSKRRHTGGGGLTTLSWRLRNPRRNNNYVFAGHTYRLYSSNNSTEDENEATRSGTSSTPAGHPDISVVGIPDPITWIRCKVVMHLIDLYFDSGSTSVDFENGVKQALVHVSNMLSRGNFGALNGIVSKEMVSYVREKCSSLTDAQRKQLAVSMDDIIFLLPEDVSVFFDQYGRSFCFIVMRFWLLSPPDDCPDDPDASKIFKVTSKEEDGSQKKIVTAVYEFHREVTRGSQSDWTVTNVWYWRWESEPAK